MWSYARPPRGAPLGYNGGMLLEGTVPGDLSVLANAVELARWSHEQRDALDPVRIHLDSGGDLPRADALQLVLTLQELLIRVGNLACMVGAHHEAVMSRSATESA